MFLLLALIQDEESLIFQPQSYIRPQKGKYLLNKWSVLSEILNRTVIDHQMKIGAHMHALELYTSLRMIKYVQMCALILM